MPSSSISLSGLLFTLSRAQQLFATPWTAACQASLSFTISQSLLKLTPIESMMPSNHHILYYPLSLLLSIFHILLKLYYRSFKGSGEQISENIDSFTFKAGRKFRDYFLLQYTYHIFLCRWGNLGLESWHASQGPFLAEVPWNWACLYETAAK